MTTIEALPSRSFFHSRHDIEVTGRQTTAFAEILSAGALDFLADLARRFECRRHDLLRSRVLKQDAIDHGWLPDFPKETAWIRESSWTVAPIPADLTDRKVEIAGPVDSRAMVAALNSRANLYMADFEDGSAPTWDNLVQGQVNLRAAVRGTLAHLDADGHRHALRERTATLAVRPRGWHLEEKHVTVRGRPISATLFDVGLFLFHNADRLLARGSAPYFYLPKVESYFEARLWNDVFLFAQGALGLPRGSIRATVVIENVLAAFQMDEILYELREHSSGLRFGQWDYVSSFIKKFRRRPFTMPDRKGLTTDQPFLRAVVDLLVRTCHRRRVHAIGGKVGHAPIRETCRHKCAQFEEVMQDMMREVADGHDGTHVAHPGLVNMAKGVLDAGIHGAHQIDRELDAKEITAKDLLAAPHGTVTTDAVRANVHTTVRYLAAWLRGNGSVPINDMVENTGTAEIARSQVWHWARHRAPLDGGGAVNADLVRDLVAEELARIEGDIGAIALAAERYDMAAEIGLALMTGDAFPEFITDLGYRLID